jgi:hypothetical protein
MTESTDNDGTVRHAIWHRHAGDDWAAYDALPDKVRARMREHAYDPWAVNTFIVWRHYRQKHASSLRAERAVLRFLDECERMERLAFAAAQGAVLPHDAAGASVLRYRHSPEPANRMPVDGPARVG